MKSDEMDVRQLAATLTSLQREMAQLSERLAALEQRLPTPAAAGHAPAAGLSSEMVAVLSAAVAAFLGVKPHIRQIRLVRNEAWAQNGRVTLQASHNLSTARSAS